ncbi:N-acetyltransferase 9-like protein isoform X2 [Chelonus insularis]|nr:N-acetyltransferase 9-like protein isoform X2 [Chelonus insularis]XP_034934262.1 N-acetyltransferase 9-like protein isoform X2 [Chelonus insularis]XP_034934264.1 N-acetyltransferase 9-like protein isoform X2 [Chelonus insularis]
MKSEDLRYLTGSDLLTLDSEYTMQQSWQNDDDKCTFIILDRKKFTNSKDDVVSMIGDTNLYFNDPKECYTAECEIMIADVNARGQRMGWEAMILMLRYGIDLLEATKYRAKIKLDNKESIQMFTKLQFQEVEKSSIWNEVTLERTVDTDWINFLKDETDYSIRKENDDVEYSCIENSNIEN